MWKKSHTIELFDTVNLILARKNCNLIISYRSGMQNKGFLTRCSWRYSFWAKSSLKQSALSWNLSMQFTSVIKTKVNFFLPIREKSSPRLINQLKRMLICLYNKNKLYYLFINFKIAMLLFFVHIACIRLPLMH